MTAGTGCTWTASSNQSFQTITAPSGGNGNGTGPVNYSVSGNTGPATRNATLTINGQGFSVTQAGCVYTIKPTSQNFTNGGSTTGSFAVSTNNDATCAWTATVNPGATWLSITSGSSGTGQGTVQYSLQPNAIGSRTGTIAVTGGLTFTVTQGP
jgi:hypothetical protein